MVKFTYRGFPIEELEKMDLSEFAKVVEARARRSIKRGFSPAQQKLLANIKWAKAQIAAGKKIKPIKTHCRDMIIIPLMLGITLAVHNGKEFVRVDVTPEKLGHALGEFALTRQRIQHSTPGVGATRGSTFVPIK